MNIMLIEDEPVISQAIIKMIFEVNISRFEIQNFIDLKYAEDAIPYLNSNFYDLIFVDIKGGDMDGLELIEKYHVKTPETQWIIISGYDKFEYAQQAILYGVSDYLLKPVTKERLSEAILKVINKRKNPLMIDIQTIDNFILELTDSIWKIDKVKTKLLISQLESKLTNKHLSLNYIQRLLDYTFNKVIKNLENKSRILNHRVTFDMKIGNTVQEIVKNFTEKCLFLIETIEYTRKGTELDPIEEAKNFIQKNLNKDLSLDIVAKKMGFNSSYFSQIFKKETGKTFVEYRTQLRMEKAEQILLKSNTRIIDVPSMIGLNDYPHFIKTFKKYTGYTPSEYQKKMGVRS